MITRTFDYRLVKRMLPYSCVISSNYYYLIHGKNQGVWVFEPYEDGLMIHAQMSVNVRGKLARDSAKASFDWVFKNTDFESIYAGIPKDRKKACFMAAWSGMKFTHELDGKRFYKVNKHG